MEKGKKEEQEKEEKVEKKSHFFIKFLMLIIVIICSLYFYAKYDGIKIVHFSDILYNSTFDLNDFKELVSNINKLKPDIIVYTGDLIYSKKISNSDKEKIIEYLSSLNASIGKYAIYGENDYNYSEYEYVITKSDFKLLSNSYEEIYYKTNEPIFIVGLPSSDKEEVNLDESF